MQILTNKTLLSDYKLLCIIDQNDQNLTLFPWRRGVFIVFGSVIDPIQIELVVLRFLMHIEKEIWNRDDTVMAEVGL